MCNQYVHPTASVLTIEKMFSISYGSSAPQPDVHTHTSIDGYLPAFSSSLRRPNASSSESAGGMYSDVPSLGRKWAPLRVDPSGVGGR